MACIKCENAQLLNEDELELSLYTYVRIGNSDVLISGCSEHVGELLNRLTKGQEQE